MKTKSIQFTLFTIAFMAIIFSSCEPILPINNGGGGNGQPSNLPARTIMDTSYGADPKQKMDIYLPAGRNSTTKVIIMIHGGGWQEGDKNDMTQFQPLFKASWPDAAVVNINYRLTANPNIHYNEIMNDVKSAVNFIVGNKSNFAVSDSLFMMGASAGGHLACLYTYKYNTNGYVRAVSDMFGPVVLNDWSWYNSYNIFVGGGVWVKDVLTRYNGVALENDSTTYINNSPYRIVTSSARPTIIFHGTLDPVVPLYQSQWLNAKLTQLNVPHQYHEYPFQFHGFTPDINVDCINKTVAFFKTNLQ